MPDNVQVKSDAIPVRTVGTPRAPSAVRTVPDQAVVAVDLWGHKGEFIRGMALTRADADEAGFDWDHAVRVGALRLLTEAEVRSLPTTFVANDDGTVDEEFARGTRYYAGLPVDVPETITGEQGPAERAEFAKPTLPFTGNDQPAARPIRTSGADQPVTSASPRAARTAGATAESKPAKTETPPA